MTGVAAAITGLPALPADLRGLNVRDFFEDAARRHPDAPFLVTRDAELSYGEVDARVDAYAQVWQELGVARGDRVAFMLDNSQRFVLAWLGLAKVGGILVGVNTRWKAPEVRYALELTRPRHVLADGEHLETVRAAGAAEALSLPDLAERAERAEGRFERPPLGAEDPISFIFTSGTTGPAKAVQQTHGNYVLTGRAFPIWEALEPGARFYGCMPLSHVNAQAYSTMGAIGIDGTLVLVERFSASRFWDDIRTYRANSCNFIGAMIAILMKAPPGPHEREHELRVMYGAPTFPEPRRGEIEARLGVKILSGFGMSETTFGLIEDARGERRSGSMGKARQYPHPEFVNEARVVDEAGRDAPPGEVGELIFRSPGLMRGYFDDPERTAEAIRDGWLYTGDYATRDADGFFYYVDRKKDIVRRRGENVSSVEVEVVLGSHPAVEEAAIVGVPSELTDEDVAAFVQLVAGASAEPAELAAWCAERLADFKVPRFIKIVPELQKTSTGKIQKADLRALAADRTGWWDREAA